MNSYPALQREVQSVFWRRSAAILSAILLLGMAGCGGGSSSNNGSNNNNPGNNPGGPTVASTSTVSGTITDVEGQAVVGATVAIGNQSTTSTQFGAYQIPQVTVPAGQLSLVTTVTATTTINGHAYSGQNTVEILAGSASTNYTSNTSNTQVIVSPTASQGSLSGTVTDTNSQPLVGARVFAAAPDPQGGTFFTTLGSIAAYTDARGQYSLPKLPPLNANTSPTGYTVTASFAGHLNQTQKVAVTTGQNTVANFTGNLALAASTTGATLPSVDNNTFTASSLTLPTTPTRAVPLASGNAFLNNVRTWIWAKKGLLKYRAAAPNQIVRAVHTGRSTPAGSLVESDLFWDYQTFNNLLGYDILRSTADTTHFASIALLRDPLADRYSDTDSLLTPDTLYYYSIARLDTVNFPVNGDEGTPSSVVSVEPLAPLALSSPADKSTLTGPLAFSWAGVNRAAKYQILLFDQFPDYQSTTSPDGLQPLWQVTAASTTQAYGGPVLQHGHTYYWTVIAADSVNSAFSVSPVFAFTNP